MRKVTFHVELSRLPLPEWTMGVMPRAEWTAKARKVVKAAARAYNRAGPGMRRAWLDVIREHAVGWETSGVVSTGLYRGALPLRVSVLLR